MIAEFLYKNPRILVLVIAVIVVGGMTSFSKLPRLEDPVLRKRVAVISTAYPGADALQVETLVTIPIEECLTGVSEIRKLRSNSRAGISNIVVELEDRVVKVDPVWSRIREHLSDVEADLPQGCLQTELEVFPLKAFAAILAVGWRDDRAANFHVLRRLTKQLRAEVLEIPGTEKLESFGDPGEEYVAEIAPSTLFSLGMSAAGIAQQVSANHSNQPAGRLRGTDSDLLLGLKGEPVPAQRVANAAISDGTGSGIVQLSAIADIDRRLVPSGSEVALIDKKPAIVLGVLVSDDYRIDEWSNQLEISIAEFVRKYPNDVTVERLFSQRKHVDERMGALLRNLALGTGAVVGIVFLLMGWRSMLVVGAALPLTALIVIIGMRMLSIPIHQMSVTGLIVAIGLLIDNAIVIVEDVRTRIVAGQSANAAILRSVRHLAMPLFGSTLTTSLAFLPIATLPGPSGEFVGTIATSVILAICASFVLAMTVVPAMSCLLGIDPSKRDLFSYGFTSSTLRASYERSLRFAFRTPLAGVLLGFVLPVVGFVVAKNLPEQFFPPSDRRQIQIEVERPIRDRLTDVMAAVQDIQAIVQEHGVVQRQHWFFGGSAPTFFYNVVPRRRSTPFYAQAIVDLRGGESIERVVRELQAAIDDRVFDSRVIVRQLEQGPPFDAPIEVRIVGPDLAMLQRLGRQTRLLLSQTASVIHTRSDLEETVPKLSIELDEFRAKQAGLTKAQISGQLYTTLEGAPAGRVLDGGEELPVRVTVNFGKASKMQQLAALPLFPASRRPAAGTRALPIRGVGSSPNPTLASLAEFRLDSDVGGVLRINGRRVNEVKAYIEAGVLPSVVMAEFKRRLAESDFELPSGYTIEFGGETEQRSHAVQSLIGNAIVLFALMLLTLIVAFRSFRCATIIAAVGGLSIGLGPLALAVFGYPFGFMAIVGTMGLVGVAINDSIVILAAIRASEWSVQGDVEGLVEVVSGCTRHILATTLTTMFGFLPLILAGGGFWPPLAICIAGGVGGATLLALYFVPTTYLLLFGRFSRRSAW